MRDFLKVYTPIAIPWWSDSLLRRGSSTPHRRDMCEWPRAPPRAPTRNRRTVPRHPGSRWDHARGRHHVGIHGELEAPPGEDRRRGRGLRPGGHGIARTPGPLVARERVLRASLGVRAGCRAGAVSGGLAGRRLALGVEGSGTRVLALQLLQATGVPEGPNLLAMGGDEAVQALLKGTVDAAFFVTARPQPQLDPLLRAKRVRLMSFAQADAFAQRFRFLSKLILPEGRLDLAANVPPADVTLLAPAAALVAREDLHPAIIDRLIQAATEVHGGGQLFAEPGQFPSPRFVDIPISPDAERYLRQGPAFFGGICRFGRRRWSSASWSCSFPSSPCSFRCCGSLRPCTSGRCAGGSSAGTERCGTSRSEPWRQRPPPSVRTS